MTQVYHTTTPGKEDYMTQIYHTPGKQECEFDFFLMSRKVGPDG